MAAWQRLSAKELTLVLVVTGSGWSFSSVALSRGQSVQDFQNQVEIWTRQTTACFSTWCQSIADELGPREVSAVSGCFYMVES